MFSVFMLITFANVQKDIEKQNILLKNAAYLHRQAA